MLITRDRVSVAEFERGTGWEIRPEGACRGDLCVPIADHDPGALDVESLAERLQMPIVRHDAALAALGPATIGGRALATAQAPELILPDVNGEEFALSSLRGMKVVLVAWAPY